MRITAVKIRIPLQPSEHMWLNLFSLHRFRLYMNTQLLVPRHI
jgi:hypothetical protein